MSKIAYTYSVVRYTHDPAAGETLNIGVIVYAPKIPYLGFRLETRYKRLAEAFAEFDGEQYRRTLRRFEQALEQLWRNMTGGLPGMFDLPPDIGLLVAQVWPDQEMSFCIGSTLAGITDEPQQTLESLFRRMVLDQYERSVTESRTDEDVWKRYYNPIPDAARKVLREKIIETEDYDLKFPHAFKNGRWHLLQPVTLDYTRTSEIQEKASRWLGKATLLSDDSDIAKLYLLLGAPRQEEQMRAYTRAKNILHKMAIPHRIVEENEAAVFAKYLADYMEEQGVIPDASQNEPEAMGAIRAGYTE